jgi:hypothetical protein
MLNMSQKESVVDRFVRHYFLLFDLSKSSQKNLHEFVTNLLSSYADKLSKPELAYIIATVHHETASTFLPIKEFGRGLGRKYGKLIKAPNGKYFRYYGRGYVQLTWAENYLKLGKHLQELGVINDQNLLINDPDSALEPMLSMHILVEGMVKGLFTGRKLKDYKLPNEFYSARQIVNRLDRAADIAKIANKALSALGEY